MALRSKMRVGDLVYESYRPQLPGIILSVREDNDSNSAPSIPKKVYKIRWLDGTISEKRMDWHADWLADFEELASEHRRKADKFDDQIRLLKVAQHYRTD